MKKVYRLLAIVLVATLLIGISFGFSNDFPDIDVDTIPVANSFSDENGLDGFGYKYAYHVCTTNSVCYSKYLLSPRCLAFRYDCIHEHPDHLL